MMQCDVEYEVVRMPTPSAPRGLLVFISLNRSVRVPCTSSDCLAMGMPRPVSNE